MIPTRVLLLVSLFAMLAACAQPELLPPTSHEQVLVIVNTVDPARPETIEAAENRLVKLPPSGFSSVKRVFGICQKALTAAEHARAWDDVIVQQARMQALQGAMYRVAQGYDPRAQIREWVRQQTPAVTLPPTAPFTHPALALAFRGYQFYQARDPHPGPGYLFAVHKKLGVMPLNTPEDLRQFTLATLATIPTLTPTRERVAVMRDLSPTAGCAAVTAWAVLATEIYGDGYFRLGPVEDVTVTTEDEGKRGGPTWRISAQVPVQAELGDAGAFTVSMVFRTAKQRVTEIQAAADLTPGLRPRDQAKQLLHPDPAVRATAEQELRQLGLRAYGYLMAERRQAGPALQQAIDRVWKRIVQEG